LRVGKGGTFMVGPRQHLASLRHCVSLIRGCAKTTASGNPNQGTLLTLARFWFKLKRHFRNDLL